MFKKPHQYKTLYYLLLFLLVFPVVQMNTDLIKVNILKGWIHIPEKPKLTTKTWLSGEFQERYNSYFEHNFGFRPWLVRIRNQIAFSLNNEAKATAVVIGKHMYLYELNYIKTYNGEDFQGYDFLRARIDSLSIIRDTLSKYNTQVIVCLAAGKGSFYPDYFPEKYSNQKSDSTNYIAYRDLLTENDFHLLDFNSWFLSMKDTSRYQLYPKYGIHWSEYGAFLAADSIIRYVEVLKGVDLADMESEKLEISNKLEGADYDMGNTLNLMFQLPSEEMAYPKIKWNSEGKDSLNAIIISDSFYWQLFTQGLSTIAFPQGGFWYYNKVVHPGNIPIVDIDYKESLKNADVIIIMATEAQLHKFPFGFLSDALMAFQMDSI